MPQSLAKAALHLIFSTKSRTPWLKNPDIQEEYRRICAKHGVQIDERYVWDMD